MNLDDLSSNSKKFVLITGAGSGIGRATAELFVSKGWAVIAIGRNQANLDKLKATSPENIFSYKCDVTNAVEVTKLISDLITKNLIASVRALVNNAGIWKRLSFLESSDQLWSDQINTNLLGTVRLTRELLKESIAQKTSLSIVNISSTLGVRPVANTAAYSASKAAVVSLTKTLALELAAKNIRVNCVCPGIVDTPIHDFHNSSSAESIAIREQLKTAQPLGRIGTPKDIAAGVYYLCSEEASWVTGVVLNIDGGISL